MVTECLSPKQEDRPSLDRLKTIIAANIAELVDHDYDSRLEIPTKDTESEEDTSTSTISQESGVVDEEAAVEDERTVAGNAAMEGHGVDEGVDAVEVEVTIKDEAAEIPIEGAGNA